MTAAVDPRVAADPARTRLTATPGASTATVPQDPAQDVDVDGLARLCELAFTSFSRSDQRRWGEMYVRGLLTVPGRKTIQKISGLAGSPAADQSLQQFVNQSPWDWSPVRYMLAQLLSTSMPVEAWIADEVAFPKNGCNSVGVTSQYVPAVGRTLNCQVALALTMAAERYSCPVNWRLMLPRCWDADPVRRRKAHVPPAERHRPTWQHLVDLVDEAVLGWNLTPPPLVADRRHDPAVEPLLRCLEDRGVRYLLRIADDLPCASIEGRPGRVLRAGELVRRCIQQRVTLSGPLGAGDRGLSSQFLAVPVPGPGGPGGPGGPARPGGPGGFGGPAGPAGPAGPGHRAAAGGPADRSGPAVRPAAGARPGSGAGQPGAVRPGAVAGAGPDQRSGAGIGPAGRPAAPAAFGPPGAARPARHARRIVAQRQWGRRQPFALWITNLSPAQLPDVAKLVRLHEQVRGELAELEQAAGLQHFEGRSFRGWHHHVTLASVAHAYRVLSADRADPRRTLRAVGR